MNPTESLITEQHTTNYGNDYEHYYIANLVLKLVTDDDVEDFILSSRDKEFGPFEDIVVEIKFKSRSETFAIQFKHLNKTTLTIEKLHETIEDLSIEKYKENFKNKMNEQPINMILFTNSKINKKQISQFKYGKLNEHKQNRVIRCLESRGCCYTIKASEEQYGDSFQSLYLYTDQPDVPLLLKCASDTFKTYFSSNDPALQEYNDSTFKEYIHFITQWSMTKSKQFKLSKKIMQHRIAIWLISSSIKPLSFAVSDTVNDRENTFREVVSKFDITVTDEKNFENIKCIWSDVVDDFDNMGEVNDVNNSYQLMKSNVKTKENLRNIDPLMTSKLMWLLRKCPLVIIGCPQVYQTIKICQIQNIIVLDNKDNFNRNIAFKTTNLNNKTGISHQIKIFQKLSDLKEDTQLYEDILNKFTYSLEGQKEADLKHLSQFSKDMDNCITTDDVVKMLKDPLLIGNQKEVLPSSHIKRTLTKIIDIKIWTKIVEKTVSLVVGVADVNTLKQFVPDLEINEITDPDKIEKTIPLHGIYICKKDVSQEQFNILCKKNSEIEFHQFRYLGNNRMEWIRSKNYGNEGRLFNESSEYTVHESEFYNSTQQDINIVCSSPGMGKSTLMKSLKNNSSSLKWTIIIHASRCTKLESKVDNFLQSAYKKYTNPFHKNVLKGMAEQKKIQLIWDGFDEASDATQRTILTLVKAFSKQGVQQWLTSRSNFKNLLEEELNTFSRNIIPYNDREQQEYIKSRLHQIRPMDIFIASIKINKNIVAFPNDEILGVPLEIYMLTELILINKVKYLHLLDGMFTVLDLYQHFVEEKMHRDKQELAFSKMKYYKKIAANSYIQSAKSSWKNRDIKFLESIKNVGDNAGFISHVTDTNNAEFSHNSYGEYFAALYLFENQASKARDKKFISERRYDNIRFFLDLMLSKNLKSFKAVMYKNPTILEECKDVDLNEKDVIGRDTLEVACAWNKRMPDIILLNGNRFEAAAILGNKQELEDLNYRSIANKFYKFNDSRDIHFKKLMLFLPFLIPFYDGNQFSEKYLPTVLYYAIRFDFSLIFECIQESIPLKNTYDKISSNSILALALFRRSKRILPKLFSEKRDDFKWNCLEELRISNSEIDEIFTFVLQLQEFRVDRSNSQAQLLGQYACEKNLHKTLDLLRRKDTKRYVLDGNGRLPIHYACKTGDLNALLLVVENGERVDIPDADGLLPIHYACQNEYSYAVEILIASGARLDIPDKHGRLPIHYASQNKYLNVIKVLIQNSVSVNVLDVDGDQPIHYACERGLLVTADLLVKNGADVNVENTNGLRPIHYARQSGNLELVKFLLKGAKSDVPDGDGRLPIHYVCDKEILNDLSLPINKRKIGMGNEDGQLPHYDFIV